MKDDNKQNIGQFPTIEIKNWDEFEEKIIKPSLGQENYFRGQSEASWGLESSLYRIRPDIRLSDYCGYVYRALGMLESMTDRKWDLSIEHFKVRQWHTIWSILDTATENKKKIDETPIRQQIPLLEYFIYLRHYGYPTPLLDWTISPYVAVFFAFSEEEHKDNIAVFKYQKQPHGIYQRVVDLSYQLEIYKHSMRTHKRHYLQQSAYLISIVKGKEDDSLGSIEQALFESNSLGKGQDIVAKYVIPFSLRGTFLKNLDLMNINYMTLFSDEQALVKTIAMRQFDFECD